MDENGSSEHIRRPDGYNRVTTVEMESQSTLTPEAASVRQDFSDLLKKIGSACHFPDDQSDFAVNLALIILLSFAVVVMLSPAFIDHPDGIIDPTDYDHQHVFYLNSLVISEIQVSPAELTGKCHVSMIVNNRADRTMHQENSAISIFLQHELLWVMRTDDFFLEGGKAAMYNLSMDTATTISVPASFVPTALSESRNSGQHLSFKIKYDSIVQEGSGAPGKDRSHVYVVCGWIQMQFVDETTLKGGSTGCIIEDY